MDSQPLLSSGLASQSVAQANKCTIKSTVNDDIDGCKWSRDCEKRFELMNFLVGVKTLPGRQMDM